MPQSKLSPKPSVKRLPLVILLLLLVAGLGLWYLRKDDTAERVSSGSQYTKGEQASDKTNSTTSQDKSSQSSSQPGDQKSNGGGGTSLNLAVPTGDFVSNHHPTFSGTPGPSMASVCSTTPGADCKIVFTKGSVTRSLNTQTTDRGGSAYWSWNINDLGLEEGTWRITAQAMLGTQTKTAQDALDLVVAP